MLFNSKSKETLMTLADQIEDIRLDVDSIRAAILAIKSKVEEPPAPVGVVDLSPVLSAIAGIQDELKITPVPTTVDKALELQPVPEAAAKQPL